MVYHSTPEHDHWAGYTGDRRDRFHVPDRRARGHVVLDPRDRDFVVLDPRDRVHVVRDRGSLVRVGHVLVDLVPGCAAQFHLVCMLNRPLRKCL